MSKVRSKRRNPSPKSRRESKTTAPKKRAGRSTSQWYRYALILIVVIVGLYSANALRWYCDDTFITLRYSDNFLAGKGLVYNEGEYVEGYTHPLWLALLILCQWLGFDPAASALNLGLLSYVGVVLIFSIISYRLNNGSALFVPVAAIVLVLNRDFLIWATGGLETMFFTFLLSLAFWLYFYIDLAQPRKLILTGLVITLSVLTRPDAVVVFVLVNICLAISRHSLRDLFWFNLPAVCVLVPYLVWKYSYYGQLLPNTYYAKSGGAFYFSRGFFYLWLYLKPYFSSWMFFLAMPAIAFTQLKHKALVFTFVSVLFYAVFFVARVGGDFMYGRFIVPMIPFAMIAFEMSLLSLWPKRRFLLVLVAAALACSIIFVEIPRRDGMLMSTKSEMLGEDFSAPWFRSHKGIIDEHYLRTVVDPIYKDKKRGELLSRCFRESEVTVVLRGRCCLGYYGKFNRCIEFYGLTDEYIAHRPSESRGRVGHEKEAPLEYLIEEGADLLLQSKWPYASEIRAVRHCRFRFPQASVSGIFVTYDRDMVKTLKACLGHQFIYADFEWGLDQYIANNLLEVSLEELRKDYESFRRIYFLHNDDRVREDSFLNRIRELESQQTAN